MAPSSVVALKRASSSTSFFPGDLERGRGHGRAFRHRFLQAGSYYALGLPKRVSHAEWEEHDVDVETRATASGMSEPLDDAV